MDKGIEVQLSPRIQKHCLKLWQEQNYKHAAHEAMIQVELALKEKGMVPDKRYGKTLIDSLFKLGGKNKTVKLRVPLGDDLQEQARNYFASVFAYYRNYVAHDGSTVDKSSALRILVIASELLDLIDASSLSYADLGGSEGLLKAKVFDNEEQLLGVLKTCDGFSLFYHDLDALRDELLEDYEAIDHHLDAIFELDLVRYTETEFYDPDYGYQEGGYLELTDLGKQIIDEIKRKIQPEDTITDW